MGLLNTTAQNYYNEGNFGSYQFTSLENIINQFIVSYVGEDKIISKAKRFDIAFHAQRALAELSFDALKSFKSQEITVPASLQMILPQDYVNYTKISTVDSAGIKNILYPTSKTSNPSFNPLQDNDGNYKLEVAGSIITGSDGITTTSRQEQITVGMIVKNNGFISNDAYAAKIFHSANSTEITIKDGNNNPVFGLNTGQTVFQFTNEDGSLLTTNNSITVLDSVTFNNTDYTITVDSIANQSLLKVGMLVSHHFIPVGTRIVALPESSTSVVISNLPLDSNTSVQVTFVDDEKDTTTWSNYKSNTPSENNNHDDYEDDIFWPNQGERYGLDPQHAQTNGSFYIDDVRGLIHFSSNVSGQTLVLDYISDSLGTDDEMQVHKFAEEAMYKSIAYAVLSTRANTQEYIVRRYKKEKSAAIRTAKLRLSNLKLEELTQTLRGKSKQIKH